MPFTRRIYQTQALFVSTGTATGQHFSSGNSGVNLLTQISRVQSINDGYDVALQDVNQFGQLGALSREIVDPPTVNLSFSYFPTDGADEKKLGFVISGSNSVGALTNILRGVTNERNYFIPTVAQGNDMNFLSGADVVDVRAIGNGFINSYSVEGSVGGFLTANVGVEALNAKYDIGGVQNGIPGINTSNGVLVTGYNYTIPSGVTGSLGQPVVIKQGDITVDFSSIDNFGATLTGVGAGHIQSFTLDVPLSLEALNRLGNRFSYAREINFPLSATLSINAIVNNLTSGSLSSLFCANNKYNINVFCRTATCDGSTGSNLLVYTLKGAQLGSQSFGASIGPAQTVDLTFSSSIGGPLDSSNNVFFSGVNP